MSDFFESMFGDGINQDDMHKAFMDGEAEARRYVKHLVDTARPLIAAGKMPEAATFLFVAVLRAAGLIKQGVYHSIKNFGEESVVNEVWGLIEEAMTAENMDKAIEDIVARSAEKDRDR